MAASDGHVGVAALDDPAPGEQVQQFHVVLVWDSVGDVEVQVEVSRRRGLDQVGRVVQVQQDRMTPRALVGEFVVAPPDELTHARDHVGLVEVGDLAVDARLVFLVLGGDEREAPVDAERLQATEEAAQPGGHAAHADIASA
jgi:hypothetical protein